MVYNAAAFKTDAEKVVSVVQDDLATVRTGRAKPSILENVSVEAYGTRMRLQELAAITAPEPSMLIVAPWDKSVLQAVEKGIASAGLNLNPVVDGDQIRIAIPALTQERRQELVKAVKQKIESGREMMRDVRLKHKKEVDGQKGKPGVSEDNIAYGLDQLQKDTDAMMEKLELIGKQKEQELMQM